MLQKGSTMSPYVQERIDPKADPYTLLNRLVEVAATRYGHLNTGIKSAKTLGELQDALEEAKNSLHANPGSTPAEMSQHENLASDIRRHIAALPVCLRLFKS